MERAKKHKEANLYTTLVLYNLDTRYKHDLLGGIRIFRQNWDTIEKERPFTLRNVLALQ